MTVQNLIALGLPLLACVVAVYLVNRESRYGRSVARQLLREAEGSITFLLDGDHLEDATPAAHALLPRRDGHTPDRETLIRALSARFGNLRQVLDTIEGEGIITIPADDGPEWVEAEYWEGFLRLTLHSDIGARAPGISALAVSELEQELESLRAMGEDSPQLIWHQNGHGEITWANRAYLDLDARLSGSMAAADPGAWPPGQIFGTLDAPPDQGDTDQRRVPVALPEADEELWFDITTVRRGPGSVHFAADAGAVVRAEVAQRNFVQTLAKTFADLAIGLAIFDRQRRLVMFNPSLMELTGLPVDFLATRPLIHSFLDRLREQRMLPEPRNYRNWREEIAALEAEAADGTYCETWMLPGGQTYRVTGRPHPDGAIAFLMEDITAEMSLTRRFRSQIETATAVFDSLDEGIAVFSPSGTLTMANAAYEELWPRHDETATDAAGGLAGATLSLREHRLRGEIERWKASCVPSDLWADIRSSAASGEERRPWTGRVRRDDGRLVLFRVVPLAAGATMVAFSHPQDEAELRPLLPAPRPVAATA
ncbi:PAS-domain containing protein [Roseisalinus antarcticus]|uniref:Sensor protein DivL n=1 Tax=Roseisalinus antarcticus TaxID=254357 RepID=A0A1Y5S1M5_9RHOB|nr:PAS-domain containing protein [Roseisalinus antarcticus]SLN30554.1 Sensor protein DivL [Roseisalinus antarcticus]